MKLQAKRTFASGLLSLAMVATNITGSLTGSVLAEETVSEIAEETETAAETRGADGKRRRTDRGHRRSSVF